jgi:hypothetical protein
VLRQSADKLTSHQRMEFSILIDWFIDTNQQASLFEVRKMRLKIKADSAGLL